MPDDDITQVTINPAHIAALKTADATAAGRGLLAVAWQTPDGSVMLTQDADHEPRFMLVVDDVEQELATDEIAAALDRLRGRGI